MANWELWITDEDGNRIELLDNSIGAAISIGDGVVGTCQIPVPYSLQKKYARFVLDRQLHAYRNGKLINKYFLRKMQDVTNSNGLSSLSLIGFDHNILLEARIIAYAAESSQSKKTGNADNIMKAIVRENLGTSAAAGRNISALGFSVANDISQGPSLTMQFAWDNLLTTLKKLQEASKALGNEVFFRIEPTNPTTSTFITKTGQIGTDLTTKYTFGPQFGNASDISLTYDYSSEINYAYAGGRGVAGERDVEEAADNARIKASKWNRREGFIQAVSSAEGDTTFVLNKAKELLGRNTPIIKVKASLQSTPNAPFGEGWNIGDKVRLSYHGVQVDTIVRSGVINIQDKTEYVSAYATGEIVG